MLSRITHKGKILESITILEKKLLSSICLLGSWKKNVKITEYPFNKFDIFVLI